MLFHVYFVVAVVLTDVYFSLLGGIVTSEHHSQLLVLPVGPHWADGSASAWMCSAELGTFCFGEGFRVLFCFVGLLKKWIVSILVWFLWPSAVQTERPSLIFEVFTSMAKEK